MTLSPVSPAFPQLPDDPDQLPPIPGGWRQDEVDIGGRSLRLSLPADPDAFLDDAGVVAANARNDYMPYWAFLWPSAVRMAQAVYASERWPRGSSVLELGSGIGVVGLAAQCRGDLVTFSDYDDTALHLCRLNARLNSLPEPRLLNLDWRSPGEEKFDVILGCEVTYDAPTHPALLQVIAQQLSVGGVCWLGDPGRYQATAFHKAAVQAGFQVRIMNEQGSEIVVPSSQGFQMFELVNELGTGV